jgi:hypothetical protein
MVFPTRLAIIALPSTLSLLLHRRTDKRLKGVISHLRAKRRRVLPISPSQIEMKLVKMDHYMLENTL